jgi:hypothetical protein
MFLELNGVDVNFAVRCQYESRGCNECDTNVRLSLSIFAATLTCRSISLLKSGKLSLKQMLYASHIRALGSSSGLLAVHHDGAVS